MKLRELQIKNFLTFKEAQIFLADRGLVSIEGKNEDKRGANSNGSGKSNLMLAILFCHWGNIVKNTTADSVVNKQAGKNCMVRATWDDDGVLYRITRYRKHSKMKNAMTVEKHDGVDWVDITKAGQLAQGQINEILGCDLPTFKASCFAQQNDLVDIPGMSDRELKTLLETTLPVEELEDLHIAAKDIRDSLAKGLYELRVDVANSERLAKDSVERGRKAKQEHDDYEAERETKAAAQEAIIEIKQKQIDSLKSELKNKADLENQIEAFQFRLDKLEPLHRPMYGLRTVLAAKKEQLRELRNQLITPTFTCGTCGTVLKTKEEVEEAIEKQINEKLKEIESFNKQYEECMKHLRVSLDITEKQSEVKKQLHKHLALEADIKVLQDQIDAAKYTHPASSVNPFLMLLDAYRKHFKEHTLKAATGAVKIKALEEKLEIAKAVADTYSPQGVRYFILESLTPYLNDRTNYYLDLLSDGSIKAKWSTVTRLGSGEYREKFSISIKQDDIEEYGGLSGGEQRKVKLACFFALQDLIAKRAEKPLQLYVGDEIDDALDTAGLERLMLLLEDKARSKSTILLISHNSLADWIPNQTFVIRKNKTSKVEGFLTTNVY